MPILTESNLFTSASSVCHDYVQSADPLKMTGGFNLMTYLWSSVCFSSFSPEFIMFFLHDGQSWCQKNVGIRWAKAIEFLSVSHSLTYRERDKLITANIQPSEICFLPLLAVSHFLKAWRTVGNKSDNDHRGIPPQGQEQKCERETEKSRNYFFIPSGKHKSHMKAKKKKCFDSLHIFFSILVYFLCRKRHTFGYLQQILSGGYRFQAIKKR